MKKKALLFLFAGLLLVGCDNSSIAPDAPTNYGDPITITKSTNRNELGDFSLNAPFDGYSGTTIPKFTWEESTNAMLYTLEIASTSNFVTDDPEEIYYKKTNIASTSYEYTGTLPKKDTMYYWKVTANNYSYTKVSTVYSFYFEAVSVSEIKFPIEDPQEYLVHEQGSPAKVGIDNSNFFGNNEPSLTITFEKEDTNRGITTSDGWIVITKAEDKELYGTDALFFNFYYSGNDANVLIRLVDDDGEYWHSQIQVSNNAKQTVLMKFSNFTLRESNTTVANRKFNYEHIRYFEIVFEKSFGDGVCMISNIRAVNFADFADMYVTKLDFRTLDEPTTWGFENYNFDKTISNDGYELKLSYDSESNKHNTMTYNAAAWGTAKIPLYKYFSDGNAIKFSFKFEGYYSSAMKLLVRVLEEDNDRWQFSQTQELYTANEYHELIIPFKAFLKSDYLMGDGARQFSYIQTLQIGATNLYGPGSLSIKDVEIVDLKETVSGVRRVISNDGIIDNFDTYNAYSEIYYQWETSVDNKDEAMKLNTAKKAGKKNKACVELDYKSDMGLAYYDLFFDASNVNEDMNAISFYLKDESILAENPYLTYLKEVSAEVTIQLSMQSGEFYQYSIKTAPKDWACYTVKFTDFRIVNAADLIDDPKPLDVNKIINFAIGFQYFYKKQDGTPYPVYTSSNPVFFDELKFAQASESSVTEISDTLQQKDGVILIEDFESYADTSELLETWFYGNDHADRNLSLTNSVSSLGGTAAVQMAYNGYSSVSYAVQTSFASSCKAQEFHVDIKGDNKATIYINLYVRIGDVTQQYRATLYAVSNAWTTYKIGLSRFNDVNGSSTLLSKNTPNIEKITFGIVDNTGNAVSHIFVDNIRMVVGSSSTNTSVVIG